MRGGQFTRWRPTIETSGICVQFDFVFVFDVVGEIYKSIPPPFQILTDPLCLKLCAHVLHPLFLFW